MPLRGRAKEPLYRAIDFTCIRLHDLRHTHARHLLMAGAHVRPFNRGLVTRTHPLTAYGYLVPSIQTEATKRLEVFSIGRSVPHGRGSLRAY
jgi:hypothetical protein